MNTQAVEDYLKAIHEKEREGATATTTALADRLGVRPASVTGMMKKLAEMNLVVHRPYQGVALTRAGRKVAVEVLRHHRLVERYLSEALGVPWDRVHEEAERWEHVLSEDLEDRMDALLGHPTTDPHGQPIPSKTGEIAERDAIRLTELPVGECAFVAEVPDRDPDLLRYLADLGVFPGERVCVVMVAPFDGPLTIRVGKADRAVGREIATHVFVCEVSHD